MLISLTKEQVALCERVAAGRKKRRAKTRDEDGKSTRSQEVVSVMGEMAFGLAMGWNETKIAGLLNNAEPTDGYQLSIGGLRVKLSSTGSAAQFLPVKQGEIHADAYVLLRVSDPGEVEIKGWALREQLERAPLHHNGFREDGYSHRLPSKYLEPLETFLEEVAA